jgi:hypothetical protein
MKCELCGEETSDVFVLLPIKQPDGRLEIIVCLRCAERSPAYCKKHERPHLGFPDNDTTACMLCIEELVADMSPLRNSIVRVLQERLPRKEFRRLSRWADTSASITGDESAVCILRAIATKALRTKQSFEWVSGQIIRSKSVDFILSSSSD